MKHLESQMTFDQLDGPLHAVGQSNRALLCYTPASYIGQRSVGVQLKLCLLWWC